MSKLCAAINIIGKHHVHAIVMNVDCDYFVIDGTMNSIKLNVFVCSTCH